MTNIFIYLKKSSPVTTREVQLKTTKGTTPSKTKDRHQKGFGEVGPSHTIGSAGEANIENRMLTNDIQNLNTDALLCNMTSGEYKTLIG